MKFKHSNKFLAIKRFTNTFGIKSELATVDYINQLIFIVLRSLISHYYFNCTKTVRVLYKSYKSTNIHRCQIPFCCICEFTYNVQFLHNFVANGFQYEYVRATVQGGGYKMNPLFIEYCFGVLLIF